MSRHLSVKIVLVVSISFLFPASRRAWSFQENPTGGRDIKKGVHDIDLIQGTWSLETLEIGGLRASLASIKDLEKIKKNPLAKPTFQKDQWLNGSLSFFEIRLDESKTPKEIDLASPDKTKLLRGIYKFEDKSLTISVPASYGDPRRPVAFATAIGDRQIQLRYTRSSTGRQTHEQPSTGLGPPNAHAMRLMTPAELSQYKAIYRRARDNETECSQLYLDIIRSTDATSKKNERKPSVQAKGEFAEPADYITPLLFQTLRNAHLANAEQLEVWIRMIAKFEGQ